MADPLMPRWLRALGARLARWRLRNKHCARCGASLRDAPWVARTPEGLVCSSCMLPEKEPSS